MRNHEDLEFEFEIKTYNSFDFNLELTSEYFNDAGFEKSFHSSEVNFTQGSKLKNAFLFNPLKWKSNVRIILSEESIFLNCKVDTANQLVSQTEIDCWDRFLNNYKNSLLQQKNLFHLNKEFVKNSKKSTTKYNLYGVFITIVLLTIFGFIADYFNLSMDYVFIPTGVVASLVIVLMQRKMNQNRIQK